MTTLYERKFNHFHFSIDTKPSLMSNCCYCYCPTWWSNVDEDDLNCQFVRFRLSLTLFEQLSYHSQKWYNTHTHKINRSKHLLLFVVVWKIFKLHRKVTIRHGNNSMGKRKEQNHSSPNAIIRTLFPIVQIFFSCRCTIKSFVLCVIDKLWSQWSISPPPPTTTTKKKRERSLEYCLTKTLKPNRLWTETVNFPKRWSTPITNRHRIWYKWLSMSEQNNSSNNNNEQINSIATFTYYGHWKWWSAFYCINVCVS